MRETLSQYNDENLKGIIAEARKILDEREKQRKDETIRRIRSLAAEAGLTIDVKGNAEKTRTPKQETIVKENFTLRAGDISPAFFIDRQELYSERLALAVDVALFRAGRGCPCIRWTRLDLFDTIGAAVKLEF